MRQKEDVGNSRTKTQQKPGNQKKVRRKTRRYTKREGTNKAIEATTAGGREQGKTTRKGREKKEEEGRRQKRREKSEAQGKARDETEEEEKARRRRGDKKSREEWTQRKKEGKQRQEGKEDRREPKEELRAQRGHGGHEVREADARADKRNPQRKAQARNGHAQVMTADARMNTQRKRLPRHRWHRQHRWHRSQGTRGTTRLKPGDRQGAVQGCTQDTDYCGIGKAMSRQSREDQHASSLKFCIPIGRRQDKRGALTEPRGPSWTTTVSSCRTEEE